MTQGSWESAIDEHLGGLGDVDWDQTSADDLPGFMDSPIYEPDDNLDLEGGSTASASPTLLRTPRRSAGAKQYEEKANNLLQMGLAFTVSNPVLVTDAAAILMHGDNVSKALGDFATENDTTAKILDFLDGGTNNAATALLMASMPFVLQLVRNHEPVAEVDTKLYIPFTRQRFSIKIPSRFKIKLSGIPRQMTNDPSELYQKTFTPAVVDKLEKKGLRVASPGRHRRTD